MSHAFGQVSTGLSVLYNLGENKLLVSKETAVLHW